jgi:CBS domain-containing protein
MPAGSSVGIFILGWLAITNVSLVIFNLIPAFPMDGGRMLRALLVRSRPYVAATRLATRIATLLALVMAILGVLSFHVLLILIALFVYGAARSESQTAMLSDLLEGITAADLMTRDLQTVTADTPVTAFIDRMLRERQTNYLVVDETGTIIGIVALRDVQAGQDWDHNTVRDIARDVPAVAATTTAFDVLTQFGRNDTEHVLVAGNNESIGLISQTDIAITLEIIQRTRDADREELAQA